LGDKYIKTPLNKSSVKLALMPIEGEGVDRANKYLCLEFGI
jgi:hypothetical protein